MKFRLIEPAPGGPEAKSSWSLWDAATKSTSSYWVEARSNLNLWLEAWPGKTDKELLGRLRSNLNEQFQGAIWELYLNWFLVTRGYLVEKLARNTSDRIPDFSVTKGEITFFVEATVVAEIQDNNFNAILERLNSVHATDYFLGVNVDERTEVLPNLEGIENQLDQFLSSLRCGDFQRSPFSDLPFTQVVQDGWTLDVTAFENRTGLEDLSLVGISSGQRVMQIIDDLKLLRKLESKSIHYDEKYQPLIIAVGEHPFRVSEPLEHRYSALFGKRVVHLENQTAVGESRAGNGFWSPGNVQPHVPALLLANRLDPGKGPNQNVEIWLAPGASEFWLQFFDNLKAYCLQGNQYKQLG